MGCFNVACSISKLSINAGDPIVFIPLLPKNWNIRNYMSNYNKWEFEDCYSDRMLIYSNALFDPMTFPIKGLYNDYGSIEDVERDANVEAIEKFLKLNVEDIVGYDRRDWPLNKNVKIYGDYSIDFGPEFLEKIGFKGSANTFFAYDQEKCKKASDLTVVLKVSDKEHMKDNWDYDIVDSSGEEVVVHAGNLSNTGAKEKFVRHWRALTGWEIGVPPEDQHLIGIYKNMGGMFFHRDVYNSMMGFSKGKSAEAGTLATATISQYILEKIGFDLHEDLKNSHGEVRMKHKDLPGWYFDVSGQYYSKAFKASEKAKVTKDTDKIKKIKELSICGCEALKKALKDHANYDLDISPLYNETRAGREFDQIKDKLAKQKVSDREYQKSLKKLEKMEKGGEEREELLNLLSLARIDSFTHPLRSPYSDSGFDCRSWPFFREIYEESFEKGTIKKDWVEWNTFMPSAYSANIHWAPAMNGEQHGNDAESRRMYEAAIAVLDKRKSEWDHEEEDEDEDPSGRTWYS